MLLIISLLVLTACSVNNEKSIASSEIPTITTTEMPKSTVSLTVAPTEMPITTGEPTVALDNDTNQENIKYGFENDMDAPYKQYIKSLNYLGKNDLKSESYYMDFSAKMGETTSKSLSNWDKELNKIYSLLMNKLPTKNAENLRIEERMWIKERDKFVAEFLPKSKKDYNNSINYNYWLYFATKNRALELIHRYYSHDLDKSLALEAYSAVFRNEAKFFSINDSSNVNKDEYLKDCFYDSGDAYQPELQFAVIDMDGDGVPEVVVEKFHDTGSENGVVLHYEDGTVYGYSYGAGELEDVKKDGSYSWIDAENYIGYSKMQFFGLYHKEVFLASYHSNGVSKDSEYLINNISVTAAEIDAFCESQKLKDNVIWYNLNAHNIKSQVANN